MKRIAIATAAVVITLHALPEQAPAWNPEGPRSPLLGAWIVEGRDLAGSSFGGVLELGGAGDRMVYRRQVTSLGGRAVDLPLERGEARLRSGYLMLREDEPRFDLVRSLGSVDGGRVERRRALYRVSPESGNALDGKFIGSSLRGGSESLRRDGADNDVRLLVDGPEAFPAIYRELRQVGSSRVDLQACKLEYSIVSPK